MAKLSFGFLNDKIPSDGYSLCGIFVMMMLFKGILVSAAGPAPNYEGDMANIVVGVVTQPCLVALPIFIVIKQWHSTVTTLLILITSVLVLKKSWYDRLPQQQSNCGQTSGIEQPLATYKSS